MKLISKSLLYQAFGFLVVALGLFFLTQLMQGGAISPTALGGSLFVLMAFQIILFFSRLEKDKPYWGGIFLVLFILLAFCVVAGSLWIMYDLDYNMMGPMG